MTLYVDFKEMVVKNTHGVTVLPKNKSQSEVRTYIMEQKRLFTDIEENAREFFAEFPTFEQFEAHLQSQHQDCHAHWKNKFYTSYYALVYQMASSQKVKELIENDVLWILYGDYSARDYKARTRYQETYFELKHQSIEKLYQDLQQRKLISA